MDSAQGSQDDSSLPLEVAATWLLFVLVAAEIFVTYSRLPPGELYHVSGDGLAGGASRMLVFSNFPTALVAIAVLVLVADRMSSRLRRAAALAGAALCAVVFWPGVVSQGDLDAKLVNVLPAIGVGAALALTFARPVKLERRGPATWDRARVVVAVAVFLLALPWLAAELGLSWNGIPVLGTLYQTGEVRINPSDGMLHPAVHLGDHHGMSGALLVWSALLLSRAVPSVAHRRRRRFLGAYLSLMLCYGAANVANDFWLEQVVKRGWASWEIPGVTTPKASPAWGVIVLAALALWAASASLRGGSVRLDRVTDESRPPRRS